MQSQATPGPLVLPLGSCFVYFFPTCLVFLSLSLSFYLFLFLFLFFFFFLSHFIPAWVNEAKTECRGLQKETCKHLGSSGCTKALSDTKPLTATCLYCPGADLFSPK
jgi:hypothetical protein